MIHLFGAADGAALDPSRIVDAWNAFFFTPESGAVSALVRMALGAVLIADSVLTIRESRFNLGPRGTYDHATYLAAPAGRRWSLYRRLPPTDRANRWLTRIHLGLCVAYLVGLGTPVVPLLVAITLTSIHHRNPVVIHSGDVLLRLLVFYSVLLPSAQVWAVDAWIFDRDPDALVTPWALRLMQTQVAIVYLRTAWWKLRGEHWRKGTAVYRVLSLSTLTKRDLPAALRRPAVYRALTWGTLVFEIGFPLLIWVEPLRWPLLIIAVVFHLGLDAYLRIRLFQWIMLAGLVAFLPPDDMTRWLL